MLFFWVMMILSWRKVKSVGRHIWWFVRSAIPCLLDKFLSCVVASWPWELPRSLLIHCYVICCLFRLLFWTFNTTFSSNSSFLMSQHSTPAIPSWSRIARFHNTCSSSLVFVLNRGPRWRELYFNKIEKKNKIERETSIIFKQKKH